MRKLLSATLLFLLLMTSVSASSLQKVYTVRDDIYTRVDALCMQSGVIGPSSFSPISGSSLMLALERIDYSSLTEKQKAEYDSLKNELESGGRYIFEDEVFRFNISPAVNIGVNIADYDDFNYGNTDTSTPQPDRREDTLVPYRWEDALFSLSIEMGFSDYVSMDARFDVKNRNQMMLETTLASIYTKRTLSGGKSGFFTGFAAELPTRAGLSAGNDFISFIFGRYPHSMGSGITGNLIAGDNFNYQEIITLSFMSRHFTYNMSVTHFSQQVPYKDEQYHVTFSDNEFAGPQQFRIIHRFDMSFTDNTRLTLNLGTLYNADNSLDLRFFYPFVLQHNYYNYYNGMEKRVYDEANNIMALEFEWNITNGLRFTSQFAMDQLQLPWENKADTPLAFGVLANIRYSTSLDKGRLDLSFEGVYTNPYLYLNGKYEQTNENYVYDYNLDYIVGYQTEYMDDYNWSGYIHGPDSIVFSLGGSYTAEEERFIAGGNILYRIRGEKTLKHSAYSTHNTCIDMSDAMIRKDENFLDSFFTPSGGWAKAEHYLKLSSYFIYNFKGTWGEASLYTALGANVYFNYNHTKGDCEFQPQMILGAKYAY